MSLLACAGSLSACKNEEAPDIVLIVVDTLRADAILDPGGRYSTPNIDALAADGVLFQHAFCHAPMTLPSHTSLFSSRPPYETGVLNNGQQVPADLPLLAEWLTSCGYDSRAVVSLGSLQNRGLERGFDEYDEQLWYMLRGDQVAERVRKSIAERDPARPLFLFAHFSDPHSPYSSHRGEQTRAEVLVDGKAVDSVITSQLDIRSMNVKLRPGNTVFELRSSNLFKVRDFKVTNRGAPLRVVWEEGKLREPVTHVKLVIDQPTDAAVKCRIQYWVSEVLKPGQIAERYAEEVEYVDRYVGDVLDLLEETGLYDDALIVFTADHGESLGEHDYFGHVNYLTDDEIAVPLIVKPPRDSGQGPRLRKSRERLARHLDLVPTMLALAGLPALPGQEGANLLSGGETTLVAETHEPQAPLDKICLRDERYKLIFVPDEDRFWMFDLSVDPLESEDVHESLGSARPEWAESLRSIARQLAESGPGAEIDAETSADLEALGYGG